MSVTSTQYLQDNSTLKQTHTARVVPPLWPRRYCFLFVQWEIKTKQFLAELRLLHPGVRLSRTAGLFIRRTCQKISINTQSILIMMISHLFLA